MDGGAVGRENGGKVESIERGEQRMRGDRGGAGDESRRRTRLKR